MFSLKVLPGESPQAFALRAGRPLCMLMRTNALIGSAWILPGREMAIYDECGQTDFPCPAMLFRARIPLLEGYIFKEGEDYRETARRKGLPERLVFLSMKEKNNAGAAYLPVVEEGMRVHTCGLKDTWENFPDEADIRLLNRCWGCLYPGMKILIYGEKQIEDERIRG